MAKFIYTMNQVGKTVPPKRQILKDISLSFFYGAKIGILGLNGAGKSTLLKIIAGVEAEFEGEARAEADVKIGYLPQEPDLDDEATVEANVGQGISEVKKLIIDFNEVSAKFSNPDADFDKLLKQQAELQDKIDSADAWQIERKLKIATEALRLPNGQQIVKNLSGGERRRVALCKLLISEPDILLLDEPTNHLDAESVAWLEQFLTDFKGTVIAITHDRYFLDNVAGWILELDRGQGIPWQGNYSSWLEQKQKRLAIEEKQASARQKSMQQELEWIRANPKGRQSKSKARISKFTELNQADNQKLNSKLEIFIPPGPRLGDLVVETKNLTKNFGDKTLIENLSFNLPAGGLVGVIGANGAGKTTLFNILTNKTQADSGSVNIGTTVKISYIDQSRSDLKAKNTVWQEISGGLDLIKVGKYETNSRAYLSRFNFKGSDQQKLVGELSGGERNRVHLAKLLLQGGNLLLLDEPTNDLDVETLRALEEAILNFPGCAVIISHDRWFLDRVASHILAFEGNSKVVWFEGNYADYELDKTRRLGITKADRVKHKKIK